MIRFGKLALGAAALLGLTSFATAADLPTTKGVAAAPVEMWSPWMVRVRAIAVIPDESARIRNAVTNAAITPASVNISNSVVPEVDISYFFTKNIAVEAICCITPHKIRGTGAIAALGQIGKTTLFPPTVMLQYHFTEMGAFKPYVGIGLNYTKFLRERSGPNYVGLNIKDSWGVAGQIGFDYMIDRHWGINFDVKKIYMEPRATVSVAPGVLAPGAVPVSAKVKINPWIIGTGVTYRF